MTLAPTTAARNGSIGPRFRTWNKKMFNEHRALYVLGVIYVAFIISMLVMGGYVWITKTIPAQIAHDRVAAVSMKAVGVDSDTEYRMVTAGQFQANPQLKNVVIMPNNFNEDIDHTPTYGFVNSRGTYYSFNLETLHGIYYGLPKSGSDPSIVAFFFKDYDPSLSFQQNINKYGTLPRFSFTDAFYEKIAYNNGNG
jgi:hypothetical protein